MADTDTLTGPRPSPVHTLADWERGLETLRYAAVREDEHVQPVVGAEDLSDPAMEVLTPVPSDPIAVLAQATMDRGRARRARRRRLLVTAQTSAGVVAVASVVAGGIVLVASSSTSLQSPAAALSKPAPSNALTAAEPTAWCADLKVGAQTRGAGPGDTTTGVGAILWLQYQMYVKHDADGARQALAPDAAAAPLEMTRAAIAAIPTGTTHCVHMIALAPDRFAVTLTERHSDGTSVAWDTIMTTKTQPDGRTLINSVTAAA